MAGAPEYSEPKKNKSGNYEIRWSEWDTGAGRSRSRSQSCGTKNFREAVAFREQFMSMQQTLEDSKTGRNVSEICDAYFTGHVAPNCRGQTQEDSLRVVRRWFDGLDVAQVTTDEVARYTESRRGQGISGTTIRKELGAMKAAMNWCAHPKRNPRLLSLDDVPYIELPEENPPRTNFLSASEADRMFQLAKLKAEGNEYFSRRRIGLFVCIALETGSRQAAIRDLTWDRVDFDTGLIDLRDPHQIATNKRRVQIPMSDRLRPVLDEAHRRRNVHNGLVLEHTGSIRTSFNTFKDEHGFDCTPHDLRRTWATLRVMWGAPLDMVAELLGDTIDVVRKHYAQFQPGYGRDVMNLRG